MIASATWNNIFTDISAGLTTVYQTNGLSFISEAITAPYTIVTSDKAKLISMGGSANYTLTVNAASLYASNFAIMAHNADSGRGKVISASGRTAFILWPFQSVLIANDANAWKFSPNSQRWKSTTDITVNVDNVNGSDGVTNDGLGAQGTSGAFATIQHAWNVIQNNFDRTGSGAAGGGNVTIQLPPTTSAPITEQVSVFGAMSSGVSEVTIQGNQGSPTACQWQLGSNQTGLTTTDYQSITLNGIGFSATGTGNTFTSTSQYGILDHSHCDFGTNASGVITSASAHGKSNIIQGCSLSGTYTLAAGATATTKGIIQMASSLAINGTVNVTRLAQATGALVNFNGLAFSGSGTITGGSRFLASNNGTVVGDAAVSWPSSMSAGQCWSGGVSDGIYSSVNTGGASAFANLPASPLAGYMAYITDSPTNALGATITIGSGGNTVLTWYNNSNWTVIGH